MITFNEKNHRYTNDKNELYTSVTTLIHKYEPFKDWDKIASKYAKSEKGLGMTKEYWLEIWDKNKKRSCESGSLYHKYQEDKTKYEGTYSSNTLQVNTEYLNRIIEKDIDNYSFKENLYDLEDGIYPELLIWDDKSLVCGQADTIVIETIKGIRYVDVYDYKTNKEIKLISGYWNKFKMFQVSEYLLAPLTHVENCNYFIYTLQLSAYAYMLEKFGFTVRNLTLHHRPQLVEDCKYIFDTNGIPVVDDTKSMDYPLTYMKDEVSKIIK